MTGHSAVRQGTGASSCHQQQASIQLVCPEVQTSTLQKPPCHVLLCDICSAVIRTELGCFTFCFKAQSFRANYISQCIVAGINV